MAEVTKQHVEKFIKTDTDKLQNNFSLDQISEMTTSLSEIVGDNEELRQAYLSKLKELTEYNNNKKRTIKENTQKDLNSLMDTFIGTNLPKGIKRKEAFELVSNSLKINKPYNSDEFKQALIEYQKNHGLEVNGKIDTETYIEAKSSQVIINIDNAIKNKKLDEDLKQDILFLIRMPKGGNIYLSFMKKLPEIKDNFQKLEPDFIKEIDKALKEGAIVAKKDPRVRKAGRTLGDGINRVINGEDSPEKFYKENKGTLLVVGLIGFIFLGGKVFGGKGGTGTIWGRLLWIIGGGILGGHKVLGNLIDKGIDGASGVIESPVWGDMKDQAKKGINSGLKEGKDFVKKVFKAEYPDVFGTISDAIGEQFDNITSNISAYNNSLKESTDSSLKELYIPTKKLKVLQKDLLGDEKFLNTSRTDLDTITDKNSLGLYINDDTKEALNKAGIKDEEIKTFIKKHLIEKSFKDDDEKVSDIFLTSEIKDKINSAIIELDRKIIEGNSELDENIKNDLSGLVNSTDPKIRNVGVKLTKALFEGELDSFKIENYPSIKGKEKTRITELIKKFSKILEGEKYIKEETQKIEKIKVDSEGSIHDTKETLQDKLTLLNGFILDSKKIETYAFSTQTFEDAKKIKKEEILLAARTLGFTLLTVAGETIDVNAGVEETKKSKEIIIYRKTLEELNISELPSIDDKPLDYKKYFDKNIEIFEKAQEIFEKAEEILTKYSSAKAGTPEEEIKQKAEEIKQKAEKILDKKELLIANYEKVKAEYVKKIEPLKKAIKKLNYSNYGESKEIIEKQNKELAEILGEVMEGFTLKDVTNFIERKMGEYIPVESKNSFVYLDYKLISTTNGPDLSALVLNLDASINQLEASFEVKPETIVKFNITESGGVKIFSSNIEEFVNEIKGKKTVLDSFKNKKMQEEKEKKLKKEISKIVTRYIVEIQKLNTKEDSNLLIQIKENFDTNIKEKLGGFLFSIGGMMDSKDLERFEKAYEEKAEELIPKYQETIRINPKLIQKYRSWGVLSFFKKYDSIKPIKNLNDNMGGTKGKNIKLIDFRKSLIDIKDLYSDDGSKKEVVKDIEKILKNIDDYINE